MSNRLACPHCLSPDHLGENAQGWREVELPVRMAAGQVIVDLRSTQVFDAERVSWFCSNQNCNVDVELRDSQLVQIDENGTPVVEQPAEQGRLA